MLTNHPNLMVPEHSCDLQHSTVTMPRKMGKTKKFAEKEEKTVIKGTGGQIRQERQFLAGELLRSKWHLFLYYWTSTGQVMIIHFPRVEKNDPETCWLRTAVMGCKSWILVYWFIDSTSWQGWSHLELFIRTWPHVPGTDRNGTWTEALMWHCHSWWPGHSQGLDLPEEYGGFISLGTPYPLKWEKYRLKEQHQFLLFT